MKMVNSVVSVIVLVAIIGVTSALPRDAYRVYRQSDADAATDAAVDAAPAVDNALVEEAPVTVYEAPVTVAARSSFDDTDIVDVAPVNDGADNGIQEDNELGLPSNASSIRANIVKTFSCEGRNYGYYADVENECQIFHVCMPVGLPGRSAQTFKWSFICPEQTIFNQESFTCTRPQDSAACEEAPQYYRLNDNFGVTTKSDPEFQSRSGVAAPADDAESRPPGGEEVSEEVTTPLAEDNSS